MRIVLAPDSFKGSATAVEAVAALERGWVSVRPHDELVARPMADGGEGTLDAVQVAVQDARRMPVRVTGPGSRPVESHWVLLPASATRPATAVVELAATSGLTLLEHPAPDDAHTLGFGEAIAAALDHRDSEGRGVDRLLLALGGSGSTDGGAGALRALGARLVDARGAEVPLGLRGLPLLAAVDLTGLRSFPPGGAVILGDVDIPLLGVRGAAAVFGPQKGVADIEGADAALAHLASLLPHVDPATPGAGAAGGAGFGLLVAGAVMASGSRRIADTVALADALRFADLVITGEGRFDAQTAAGKAPAEVARLAADAGVPVAVVAGSVAAAAPVEGLAAVVELAALAGGSAAAIAQAEHWLEHAGAALARRADTGSFARP